MATTARDRTDLFVFLVQLAMAARAHLVIGLPQCPPGWIQVGLKPKANLILVASGTLDAIGSFIELHLVYNILPIFEPVMARAALNAGIIKVSHMRKVDGRSTPTAEYRLIIQHNILGLGV
jgi:hypothetical protein